MAKRAKEKYLVLMADDIEDDCLLIKIAMTKAQRLSFLGSVSDGEELLEYLRGSGKFADRSTYPVPDMLLLDLKMPRLTGFEVLEWLQNQPFDDMVVVVLSGSDHPADRQKAMQLGADHYHTKEVGISKREELIRKLEEYLANTAG